MSKKIKPPQIGDDKKNKRVKNITEVKIKNKCSCLCVLQDMIKITRINHTKMFGNKHEVWNIGVEEMAEEYKKIKKTFASLISKQESGMIAPENFTVLADDYYSRRKSFMEQVARDYAHRV
jgi:hypothetical protein